MSGEEVHIVAILKPTPGKTAEFNAELKQMCQNVHNKEQGTCLRFLETQEIDSEDPNIIIFETYKNKHEAVEHGKTEWFKNFFASVTDKGLLDKSVEPKIMYSKSVSGFDLDRNFVQ